MHWIIAFILLTKRGKNCEWEGKTKGFFGGYVDIEYFHQLGNKN